MSLTGVQAFLRDDLLTFCREAPPEFNEHQRDVFCVFSGLGVARMRNFLNTADQNEDNRLPYSHGHVTMFNEGEDGDQIVNVTARANGMAIDEMEEEYGDSEMVD